eukprot:9014948-Lingulodinium_polyedra.AAC.1
MEVNLGLLANATGVSVASAAPYAEILAGDSAEFRALRGRTIARAILWHWFGRAFGVCVAIGPRGR